MNIIQTLPADVRACIRTGVALTSFAQAVEELVLNSIDAGASSVAVRVDLSCFRIQVVDNGKGISLDQFQLIGERYSTSKCHTVEDLDNLKYFGYRGEALASLRTAASFLEIVSRPKSSVMTYSKCFQNGAALGVIQSSMPRPSVGTTVTAHDLFYNLPVRRKRVNSVLEIEKIRYRLAGIALIWPHVSFSLRDDSAGHVILQTYKCSGVATSFSYIFTPARARGLMEVAAEQDEFRISGLVSKESYSRMDLQFVFINKRLVLKSSIHRQINKILSRSLILRRKGFTNETLTQNVNVVATSTGSPQKQLERFAIFVINIECPYSAYDITFDPTKTLVEFHDWPKLIHLLQDMLYGFLRKENLMSITEPASSNSPCDDGNEDDIDKEENNDSCQNNLNPDNGFSNENEDERRNVSLGNVYKSGKSFSTFLENGLFSKTVHRPKNQMPAKGIISEEQTESRADTHGECSETSLSQQLQPNTSLGTTVALNLNQQKKEKHSSVLTTSHPDNTSYCHQKPLQTVSDGESILTSQVENEMCTKQVRHQNVPNKYNVQSGNWSASLRQHSSEKNAKVKPYLQAAKHSLCVDSEEVIIKKPALSKKSEITLGNSVQYSSTLKSLRDMNQTSSSSKVSAIITNTLQQLRSATKKSVKNLGDLYKTPKKSAVLDDACIVSSNSFQMKKDEVATANVLTTTKLVLNTDASMQNDKRKRNIPHNANMFQAPTDQCLAEKVTVLENGLSLKSKPHPSATFISTTEDRSLGESDRVNGQKRPSCHNSSHASKLAKLMRCTDIEENQDVCDKDSRGTDSRKYTKILNAFNYNKLKKNTQFKHADTNTGFTSSFCIPGESLKECDQTLDTPFSGDSLECSTDIAAQHLASKGGTVTAGGNGTTRWDLSLPSSSSTKELCSKPACNRCCCCLTTHQTRGQLGHLGDGLPFSLYKADGTLNHAEVENSKTPKVSVILSLPLDDSDSSVVESLERSGQDRSTVLGFQKLHVHAVSSYPDKSLIRENISVSAPTLAVPFRNHSMYNKNKHKKLQNLAGSSKDSPDQSLPTSELKSTRNSLVGEHLNIISQPEIEAEGCGSSPVTPPLSQGFTVITTHLDKDGSEGSSDDLSSACNLQENYSTYSNLKSPTRCESSGFSPTNEASSSSLERSSPWTQSGFKTSDNCLHSKATDGPGASVNYIRLSDSDTEIYIRNRTHSSPDNLYCEGTWASQEAVFDAQLHKDVEVTDEHYNSGSVLPSSAKKDIADTDIDSVLDNTEDEHAVLVSSAVPSIANAEIDNVLENTQDEHTASISSTVSDKAGTEIDNVVANTEIDNVVENTQNEHAALISSTMPSIANTENDKVVENTQDKRAVLVSSSKPSIANTEIENVVENTHDKCAILVSSAVPSIANTEINNVVKNTQNEHASLPAMVSSAISESLGEQSYRKPLSQTNLVFYDPNFSSILDTENREGVEVDSYSVPKTIDSYSVPKTIDSYSVPKTMDSYSVPGTSLKLADGILCNGDKENILANECHEDWEEFTEITNMISDAKQMFKNMQEFLSAPVPSQDTFTHSFVSEKVPNASSHHGHTFDHSRNSKHFLENVSKSTCENMLVSEIHPSEIMENHDMNSELPPLPEAANKDSSQSSLKLGLLRENDTRRERNTRKHNSNLNTELLPFEDEKCDTGHQNPQQEVFGDHFISLKDGLDLGSGHLPRGSLSLRFQTSPTASKILSEEMLGHKVSSVDEKDAVQRPAFLNSEVYCDSFDSKSRQEFTEVKPRHTQIQNLCNNSSLLDDDSHLQIERPASLFDENPTDDETDQAEVMSSEGDQILMMIHESDLSPGDVPDQSESSSRGNSLTKSKCLSHEKAACLSPEKAACLSPEKAACLSPEKAACLSPDKAACLSSHKAACSSPQKAACLSSEKAACLLRNENMSFDKVSSEITHNIVTAEAVHSNDNMIDNCRVAKTVRYQPSGSEIGLSHFDGIFGNRSDSLGSIQPFLMSSSLSLIRPDGLTGESSKMFHPGRHEHHGNVSSAKTGTEIEVEMSTTNQKMSYAQATSNTENDAEQMKETSSEGKEVEIGTQHNRRDDEGQKETAEIACWKEVIDSETGTKTFVSNLSGHTVNEEQWEQLSSQTKKEMLGIHSECVVIPALNGPAVFSDTEKQAFNDLVARHFEQEENEALSKWREGERPVYDTNAEADVSSLIAKWTNPVFINYKQPGVLADPCPSDTVSRSCFHSLSSVEFTKSILDKVKVIGQLDNKFIVSMIDNPESSKGAKPKCSSLLVLFDQHAVHERIRLEHFNKECYEVEGGERTDRIKRSEVKPAQPITMDQDDMRIMKAFSTEFTRIGINFSVDKTSRNTIQITSLPLCFIEKDSAELKKNKVANVIETVENLIKEHIELLKSTNGVCGRLPLAIHRVLCSQACHGAVKFGDKLTVQECQDLLTSLALCSLPFQCAHGRPSLAPLVNLDAVERELLSTRKPPNLWKISQHIKH